MNDMPKFDYILMNPPYGAPHSGTSPYLHLDITFLVVSYGKRVISLMPESIMVQSKSDKKFLTYKNELKKFLIDFKLISSSFFIGTDMKSVGIYVLDDNKDMSKHYKVDDLLDRKDWINETEEKICKILSSVGNISDLVKTLRLTPDAKKSDWQTKFFKTLGYEYYLNVSSANGSGIALWFSGLLDKIDVLSREDEKQYLNDNTSQKSLIGNDNKIWLMNLKKSMKRPLLRFALYILQDDQGMTRRVYKYVPNIDYAKVNSDEDILRLCGCNESDIKEIIEYVNTLDFKIDQRYIKRLEQ